MSFLVTIVVKAILSIVTAGIFNLIIDKYNKLRKDNQKITLMQRFYLTVSMLIAALIVYWLNASYLETIWNGIKYPLNIANNYIIHNIPSITKCELQSTFDKARKEGINAQIRTIEECKREGGPVFERAQAELKKADIAARDLSDACIDALSMSFSCSSEAFTKCIEIYTSHFSSGEFLSEIRLRAKEKLASTKCKPSTPPVITPIPAPTVDQEIIAIQNARTCFDEASSIKSCRAEPFSACLNNYASASNTRSKFDEFNREEQQERESERCKVPSTSSSPSPTSVFPTASASNGGQTGSVILAKMLSGYDLSFSYSNECVEKINGNVVRKGTLKDSGVFHAIDNQNILFSPNPVTRTFENALAHVNGEINNGNNNILFTFESRGKISNKYILSGNYNAVINFSNDGFEYIYNWYFGPKDDDPLQRTVVKKVEFTFDINESGMCTVSNETVSTDIKHNNGDGQSSNVTCTPDMAASSCSLAKSPTRVANPR